LKFLKPHRQVLFRYFFYLLSFFTDLFEVDCGSLV
jgi:hypothetical protein